MKFGEIVLGGKFGGYEIINKSAEELPQDLASAFPDVLNKDGYIYTPVWYYGKQLVNGYNHMMVCNQFKGGLNKVAVAIINIPPGSVCGKGAKLVELALKANLYGDLNAAFEEVLAPPHGLLGVGYKPVAYMGSKMTKGITHYVLCEADLMYPGSNVYPVVVAINFFNGIPTLAGIEPLGGIS